jgi:hypothetical protein
VKNCTTAPKALIIKGRLLAVVPLNQLEESLETPTRATGVGKGQSKGIKHPKKSDKGFSYYVIVQT